MENNPKRKKYSFLFSPVIENYERVDKNDDLNNDVMMMSIMILCQ